MNRGKGVGSRVKGRSVLRLIMFSVAFFLLLQGDGSRSILFCKTIARVGILPFQVYSAEKVSYLQEVISSGLAQQLEKKGLSTIDPQEIARTVGRKEQGGFTPKEVAAIAHKTGSDFLVYGSLTKIDDNVSIDARVFSSSEGNAVYKDFTEGKDLDRLIENLGTKISQRIAKVTVKSSPSEPITEAPETESDASRKDSAAETVPSGSNQVGASPAPSPAGQKVPSADVSTPSPIPESSGTSVEESTSVASVVSPSASGETEEPSPETSSKKGTGMFGFDKKSSSAQPVNITSDRMEADNRNRTVNFMGNVVAKREDMVIFSDRISAFYAKDGKIDRIVAQGNVRINQNDRMATCLEATFFQTSQKIVLTGKPKVWQGSNIITGDTITLSLKEDRVDIEGGKQTRVNATIYPMGKTEK